MRTVIGVMGSGEDRDAEVIARARELGSAIAKEGWVLLNGGRAAGVMDASASGAKSEGGLVIGVLPDEDLAQASSHLDVAIRTGMGDARNAINVLSSDVVVVLSGGAGTISEAALALKAGRSVISLGFDLGSAFDPFRRRGQLKDASSVPEAISLIKAELGSASGRAIPDGPTPPARRP